MTFQRVSAIDDIDGPTCASVGCCVDNRIAVRSHGNISCDFGEAWYKLSGCCHAADDAPLHQLPYWPTYIHLDGLLEGHVMHISRAGETDSLLMSAVIAELLHAANATMIPTVVTNISKDLDADAWNLLGQDHRRVVARKIIFANGGFGAQATPSELSAFAVASSDFVHARNTRLLRDLSLARSWEHDDLNAWYLEFSAPGVPKWFLWDAAATVLAGNQTVYNEAASYDERGRIRARRNISEAAYLYEDAASEDGNDVSVSEFVEGPVHKRCDSRSMRLWRNYLPLVYGIGSGVDAQECARRVSSGASAVRIESLHQGIIDTIAGPRVDEHQRLLSDGSVYVVGNAGSPSLLQAYVGPGSTLGHAFISGFVAGRHAATSR